MAVQRAFVRASLRKTLPQNYIPFYLCVILTHINYLLRSHFSLIGQFEHPHPQEVLPFFLFFIICVTTAATTAINITDITIVAPF